MRIAICDDNVESLIEIKETIQTCGIELPDVTVEVFSSAMELIASYSMPQTYDLLLLDVEMPELDGLQVGKRIREIDKNVLIVYLTSHKQYVFKSMSIEVFDYLIKPPDIAEVRDMLKRAYNKYRQLHYIVSFKYEGTSYSLEVGNIVYLEGYNRYVFFHTNTNEKHICLGKLNDFDKKLEPYGFLRCHQGYLVNMKYISSIDKQKIVTTAGQSIEISVRKRQACLRAYNKYLARYGV